MTTVPREVRPPAERDAEKPTAVETLKSVWALLPVLAVLNLVAAAAIFAASPLTGGAPWASVCLYPVPTLWLLIVLEQVLTEREGERVQPVRAVFGAAGRAVRPALVLGVPVSVVMLSALVAGQLWLSVHAVVMLLPLLLGTALCSVVALAATTAARRAVRSGRNSHPFRELGPTVKETIADPGRSLAAATCLVAIPVLAMVLNPGVLLAIPAPFALCALLASRTAHPADAG